MMCKGAYTTYTVVDEQRQLCTLERYIERFTSCEYLSLCCYRSCVSKSCFPVQIKRLKCMYLCLKQDALYLYTIGVGYRQTERCNNYTYTYVGYIYALYLGKVIPLKRLYSEQVCILYDCKVISVPTSYYSSKLNAICTDKRD